MKIEELKRLLDEAIKEEILKEEERLLGSDYCLGYDSDEVNIGVGCQSVRSEIIIDEDRLNDDARENVADSFLENLSDCGVGTKLAELHDFIKNYIEKGE